MNRFLLTAMAVALLVLFSTRDAAAQGTCHCNSGCHEMPGQCLISGSGCDMGYAPLCDYRPEGTCPHVGAVSCNGGCTCTPIPGYDAGVPPDASGVDVPVAPDVPVIPVDVPAVDAPAIDAPLVEDVPLYPDTQFADVSCPTGVVVEGICYSTPCEYQMEIGFVCTTQGFSCRQISGGAWCIPVCAGTVCDTGQYCDPTFGCSNPPDGGLNCANIHCVVPEVCDPVVGCMTDRCTNVSCPTGNYCLRGDCVAIPDGAGVDGGARADAAADGGNQPRHGACGCRTPGEGRSSNGSVPALLAALGALAIVRRRRDRR